MENQPGNILQKSQKGRKAIFAGAGVATVCMIAGMTFAVLSLTVKRVNVAQTQPVTPVETAATLDTSIQSDIDNEQNLDDSLAAEESQSIEDEINTSQTLEGNYEGY